MVNEIHLWTKLRELVRTSSGHRKKTETMMLREEMAKCIMERFNHKETALRLASFYQAILDSDEGYRSISRGSNEKIQLGSETLNELYEMISLKKGDVETEENKLKALQEYCEEYKSESFEITIDEEGNCVMREKVI